MADRILVVTFEIVGFECFLAQRTGYCTYWIFVLGNWTWVFTAKHLALLLVTATQQRVSRHVHLYHTDIFLLSGLLLWRCLTLAKVFLSKPWAGHKVDILSIDGIGRKRNCVDTWQKVFSIKHFIRIEHCYVNIHFNWNCAIRWAL